MSTISCSDTDNAENSSPEKQPRRPDAKRRNLKTQAERRRRERINMHFQNLLGILHTSSSLEESRSGRCEVSLGLSAIQTSLPGVVPSSSSSGANAQTANATSNSADQRMEKAEILEKAVERINLLESNLKSCEALERRCFITGFKDCARQLYKFVQAQSDLDSVSKQRICSTLMQQIHESNAELNVISNGNNRVKSGLHLATSSPIKRSLDTITNSPGPVKQFATAANHEAVGFQQMNVNKENNVARRYVTYHEDPPGMKTLLLEDTCEESPTDSRLNASACCTSRSPITLPENWKSHYTQLRVNNGLRISDAKQSHGTPKLARLEPSTSRKLQNRDENSPAHVPVWRPW